MSTGDPPTWWNIGYQHSHLAPAGTITFNGDQLGVSDGSGIRWIDALPSAEQLYGPRVDPLANQPYGYNTDLMKMRDLLLMLAHIITPYITDESIVLNIEQLRLALGDYSVAPKVEQEKYLDNELFEL